MGEVLRIDFIAKLFKPLLLGLFCIKAGASGEGDEAKACYQNTGHRLLYAVFVSNARDFMVIYHADRLHEGIDNHGADKFKAAFFKVF